MHWKSLLILAFFLRFKNYASELVYKSSNVECSGNSTRVKNVLCTIKALNWNKAVIHMDCDLVLPLRNVSVQLQVFKKDYSTRYQPFLVDVFINLCDIFSKRNYLPYGIIIRKLMSRFSNFNHSCPFEGHIYARDFYVDENLLPKAPIGFYLISVNVMENYAGKPSDYVGALKIYVQAMETVELKRKKKPNN